MVITFFDGSGDTIPRMSPDTWIQIMSPAPVAVARSAVGLELAREDVAPEHVFIAIAELFTRRQVKSKEDLRPKLRAQLVHAFDQSGLLWADYLSRIGTPSDDVAAVLDEAIAQVGQQRSH